MSRLIAGVLFSWKTTLNSYWYRIPACIHCHDRPVPEAARASCRRSRPTEPRWTAETERVTHRRKVTNACATKRKKPSEFNAEGRHGSTVSCRYARTEICMRVVAHEREWTLFVVIFHPPMTMPFLLGSSVCCTCTVGCARRLLARLDDCMALPLPAVEGRYPKYLRRGEQCPGYRRVVHANSSQENVHIVRPLGCYSCALTDSADLTWAVLQPT